MNPKEILGELLLLKIIAPDKARFDSLLDYAAKCVSISTPSHEISITDATFNFINAGLRENAILSDKLEMLSNNLNLFLRSKGYRDMIYTEQELDLLHGDDERKTDYPYMPKGLLDGRYSLEETEIARELQRFYRAFKFYFDLSKDSENFQDQFIGITLEPLGADGNTLSDPKPVNKDLKSIQKYSKTNYFPYVRNL